MPTIAISTYANDDDYLVYVEFKKEINDKVREYTKKLIREKKQ